MIYSPDDGGPDATINPAAGPPFDGGADTGADTGAGADGGDASPGDGGGGASDAGDGGDGGSPLDAHRVIQISAGFGATACALTIDGLVYCWGDNSEGEVGDGTRTNRSQAVWVQNDSTGAPFANIIELTVGGLHVCARDKYRYFYCWGDDDLGQLGDGRYNADGGTYDGGVGAVVSLAPSKLSLRGTAPVQIVAGATHSCIIDDPQLDAGLNLECWGTNAAGELGHDPNTNGDVVASVGFQFPVNPQPLGSLTAARDLSGLTLGTLMGCYLRPDETVWCWGSDTSGVLGNTSNTASTTPLQVPRPDAGVIVGALEVSARSNDVVCARESTTNGHVWCWGDNNYGELGTPASIDAISPPVATAIADVQQIAVGTDDTCALVGAQGNVMCWGSNSNGQLGHVNLGDPTCGAGSTPCDGPTLVGTLDDAGAPFAGAVQISVGLHFACALKADGSVWCWGTGASGQLGNGATADSSIPVRVLGLP